MANFEILDSIPSSYKKEYIDSGTNGVCYKTEYGDVFKEFKREFEYEDDILNLTNIKSKYIAFPFLVTYLKSKSPSNIKGYRMDYADGITFNKIKEDESINSIINSSSHVESEIIRLTRDYGITLYNICSHNVIFQTNGEFKIIDTDLSYVDYSKEEYEHIKTNLLEWNQFLLYSLNKNACGDIFKSDRLNMLLENALVNGKIRVSNVLEETIEEMKKEMGCRINTIRDYNKGLELIKRK